jgi:hypothetical protein
VVQFFFVLIFVLDFLILYMGDFFYYSIGLF